MHILKQTRTKARGECDRLPVGIILVSQDALTPDQSTGTVAIVFNSLEETHSGSRSDFIMTQRSTANAEVARTYCAAFSRDSDTW